MSGNYILRGKTPVREHDLMHWARWFEAASHSGERIVASTLLERADADEVRVSTVFIGIDMNFFDGPPLLFESMVFGGPLNEEQYRYCTWDEAMAGHLLLTEEATIENEVRAWEVGELLKKAARRLPVMTWTCHVCGEERPNALICVYKTDRSAEHALPEGTLTQNVRYCTDREQCVEGAKAVDWWSEQEKKA